METKKLLEELEREVESRRYWPEPQSGAGKGLGPLAGVGMYMQYEMDKKKHEQQMEEIIEIIRTIRGNYSEGERI